MSHVSAQRGSTNRHYLLLEIPCPQSGARLHVLLVHMPFTSPRLPPFPLLSLSSLPHHVTPAESNMCQGQSMPEEELHADPPSTLKGNGNKAANVSNCPSC